jgi:hypothetical protein
MNGWRKRTAQISQRLAETPPEQRVLFAAGVAERLLAAHERRPAARQSSFTLGLRPLLDDVWAAACGDQTVARNISQRLGQFYISDLYSGSTGSTDKTDKTGNTGNTGSTDRTGSTGNTGGKDSDEDAEEDAAAAVLHAAECYVHGTVEYAVWAGDRAAFAADETVQAEYHGDWAPARESADAIQRELDRQWRDLDLIQGYGDELRYARSGLPSAVTQRLLTELRPRLVEAEADTATPTGLPDVEVGPPGRATEQGQDPVER